MTAFTVNGGGTTEWDSLSGGSVNATLDSYAISNNTTLRIACDSYQCTNHTAAFGSLDTVTFPGIGGRVLIDGTAVRVIPFNTGASTVPAVGTTVSQGGVSGALLGVWSGWQTEPLAAGAAMPATGFIKIKSKTGGDFAAGALAGISASATGPDVVGWIEVRGADTAIIVVPRLGKFEVIGDWFELGTTNGTSGQVLPCPTTATVAGVFPGIWVETGPGTDIFERWCGVGDHANNAADPTDERGKMFWQTTSGIRIGSNGTNNVGFLPPSGCKVRIPNVILTCCTRTAGGSGARVMPNATLATRQELDTYFAGNISISNCVFQWYGNFLQAFRADLLNSAFSDTMILQEIASPIYVENCIVAPSPSQLNFALNMVSCFAGGTFKDTLLARASLAASANYVNTCNYNKGITFENVKSISLLNRGHATTGCWTCTQTVDCTWEDCTNIGGGMVHYGAQNLTIRNHHHVDIFSGTTLTTFSQGAIDCFGGCVAVTVDGLDFLGLTNVHPYGALLQLNASYQTKLRNIGTYASPLNLGSVNACGLIVSSSGNNDDVRVQRVFCSNTRTGTWAFLNSDNGITLEQVKGDYADTSVITALNAVAKGVALTGATTGQASVYGAHWKDSFTSVTVGKIEILCNEPTAISSAQCASTGGTPRFDSSGQVALTAVGDELTWEMPYFARGHTAFANLAATLTGTNTGNLVYEFQYDKGSGYNGTWLIINGTNLSGAGAINPAVGVRIKVRARCQTANAGNLLTNIAIPTITNATDQGANLYPLDTFTLTLTGLQTGSDVVVLQAGTETELVNADAVSGTSYDFVYEASEAVDIAIFKTGYVPFFIRNFTLPANDNSLPVAQVADRNYLNA